MKIKFIIILIISFIIVCIYSFNYSKEEAFEILQQNCPDSYAVVNTLFSIPPKYGSSTSTRNGITHWLKPENPIEYLTSFSTAVHEIYHSYNAMAGKFYLDQENKQFKSSDDFFCYFITKDKHFIVSRTDVFPCAEMASQFSFALKMDRFSTYISPSSEEQSTQKDGVYALLDEWNAYYLGTKTLFELIPLIKNKIEPTAENWKDYFYNMNSDFIAYSEFKLYVLNYLLYAKTAHPEMYQKIVDNKSFVNAYHEIDTAYGSIVEKYLAEKVSLIDYLNGFGLKVSEDETSIFFDTEGVGNYVFKHKKMMKEFAKDKYAEILNDLKN